MNSRERVLAALNLEIPDRVPWMEAYVHKEITESLANKTVEMPSFSRIAPETLDYLNLDNITIDLRPPEFAEKILSSDGNTYTGKGLLTDWDKLQEFQLPDPNDEKIFKEIKDYIDKNRGDKLVLLSTRGGPANTYLSLGIENFSLKLYDDLEFIEHVMDMFTDWICVVASKASELGFDAVRIGEDWAHKSGPFFSRQIIKEIFIPRLARVVDCLDIPWIYHSDGDFTSYLEDILELKPAGLTNIEPGAMDIEELKRDYGDKVSLVGNIDLGYTLPRGSVEETKAEVKERIEKIGKGGGFVLASSNGITRYCKPENVVAISEIVEEYGYY